MTTADRKRWGFGALAVLSVVGIPLMGLIPNITVSWAASAGVIIAVVLLAGWLSNDALFDAVIDSRNKVSLSQLQMAAWTTLILSAFSTAVFWNISNDAANPLAIAIPAELWAAMGISVASFVGSSIVKKKQGAALDQNAQADQARMSDIVMVEGANDQGMDFGKVQMLLFTVILLVTYGAALQDGLMGPAEQGRAVTEFPSVSGGMLALLGLSHSGYLVQKNAS